MNATKASSDTAAAAARRPSRFMASLFLLLGVATLVLASRPETNALARYLIGIGVEVALALLALLFMRLERLSIVKTARLRVPTRKEVLLGLAIVPGMWMTGVVLNVISLILLGYNTPVTPAMYPANVLEAITFAVTTMIIAPIAEELMFRGYVQRAFERRGPWHGVIGGGLIFAIYHLKFQGVFPLLPVAFALGFVAWRSQSLFPAIAMHAAYNTIATVLVVAINFLPMELVGGLTGAFICLGILITPLSYAALWWLWRSTEPQPRPSVPSPSGIRRWAWVVLILVLIGVYGYVSVNEFLIGRFPEQYLDEALALETSPAWQSTTRWRYRVQNLAGRELGTASCTRTPERDTFVLSCKADYEGFTMVDEIPGLEGFEDLPEGLELPNILRSFMRTEPKSWTLDATWTSDDLSLTEMDAVLETPNGRFILAYPSPEGDVMVGQPRETSAVDHITVTGGRLLIFHEWAWRLSAMPLELPFGGDATLVPDVDQTAAYDAFVNVQGGEPVWTPLGTYVTWKVTVTYQDAEGREQVLTAWYDTESPHTLIRYDDGDVSYVLAEIETAGQLLPDETMVQRH